LRREPESDASFGNCVSNSTLNGALSGRATNAPLICRAGPLSKINLWGVRFCNEPPVVGLLSLVHCFAASCAFLHPSNREWVIGLLPEHFASGSHGREFVSSQAPACRRWDEGSRVRLCGGRSMRLCGKGASGRALWRAVSQQSRDADGLFPPSTYRPSL
jgi:hypothetical protein